MPLHDWSKESDWEGVHVYWLTEIARQLKTRLPEGFRAHIGTGPALAVDLPPVHPDVSVRIHKGPQNGGVVSIAEPDIEIAAFPNVDPDPIVRVEWEGRLVAAIELISPRNKDRDSARIHYTNRYLQYLLERVNLMLVDVHPRPVHFSFFDKIAEGMESEPQPALPPPMAVSYRVGEPAAMGGRYLAIWRRQLTVGDPIPEMPLPLDVHRAVSVDLESSYMRAAADAYLT
jgi:hypothetical protein